MQEGFSPRDVAFRNDARCDFGGGCQERDPVEGMKVGVSISLFLASTDEKEVISTVVATE